MRERADDVAIPSLMLGWGLLAVVLLAGALALVLVSVRFAPEVRPAEMPIAAYALLATALGVTFLSAIPLVRASAALGPASARRLLTAIIALGALCRLLLLASEPVLEADHNRYLWDGGVTAHGFNPFSLAPAEVSALAYHDPRLELSKAAAPVFERISYPDLKTIYPPVAQAAFALAHMLSPWSLLAWRCVCLAGEALTLVLLLALLARAGRSPLWCVLYWWNPLVLKEIANSAHMEAVLMPLVLGALWFAAGGRHLAATVALGLAIGAKLWPVVLVPLLLRPLAGRPLRLLACLIVLAALACAMAAPVLIGGLDGTSGFVAFAAHWSTNNALVPQLERLLAFVLAADPPAGRIVRAGLALALLAAAVSLAARPIADARDLLLRAYLTLSALVLLSPAQFPWYLLWVLPLAAVVPGWGWQVAAALMPLYYTAFHFRVTGAPLVFDHGIVWLIWVPVWLALAADARRSLAGFRHARPEG